MCGAELCAHDEKNPFALWNKPSYLKTRNCYAFACDAVDPDFSSLPMGSYEVYVSVPGGLVGDPFDEISPPNLAAALVRDGFITLPHRDPREISIPKDHYLIAGFCGIPNGFREPDYHFYRYHEESRTWYHKFWNEKVTNFDASNRLIVDPCLANRWGYKDFFGFFLSPPDRKQMTICLLRSDDGHVMYGYDPCRKSRFCSADVPALLEQEPRASSPQPPPRRWLAALGFRR